METLSAMQVARIFGVGIETVRRLGRQGKLPGMMKVGHRLRFRKREVESFFSACWNTEVPA